MPDPSSLDDGDDDVVSDRIIDQPLVAITDLLASCGCAGESKD